MLAVNSDSLFFNKETKHSTLYGYGNKGYARVCITIRVLSPTPRIERFHLSAVQLGPSIVTGRVYVYRKDDDVNTLCVFLLFVMIYIRGGG